MCCSSGHRRDSAVTLKWIIAQHDDDGEATAGCFGEMRRQCSREEREQEKMRGREALQFSVFCALGKKNDLITLASEGVKFTIYYVSFFIKIYTNKLQQRTTLK